MFLAGYAAMRKNGMRVGITHLFDIPTYLILSLGLNSNQRQGYRIV